MAHKTIRITLYGHREDYASLKKLLDGYPVSLWFRQQIKKALKKGKI